MPRNSTAPEIEADMVSAAYTVIDQLNEMGIRPVPPCFEGWFYYQTKGDLDIVEAVSKRISDKKKLSEEDFVEIRQEVDAKKMSLHEINSMISGVVENVNELESCQREMTDCTSDLQSNIATRRKQFDAPGINAIKAKEIIGEFATELAKTQKRNQELEQRLSASSEQISELKECIHIFEKQVNIDALTNVYNRRYFDARFLDEVMQHHETDNPLALLVFDLDYFKSFNDTFGHDIGDQLLKYVAQTLRSNSKGKDVVARFGGDEFVMLLTNTTAKGARMFADMICKKISSRRLRSKSTDVDIGHLTVTIGATMIVNGDTPAAAFKRADEALYVAKKAGRNNVKFKP